MKTWYIVKVSNGFGDRIQQQIAQKIIDRHLESHIAKVVAPDAGKMPIPKRIPGLCVNYGYSDKLLVFMESDDETRRKISSMFMVKGFVTEHDLTQHEGVTGVDLRQWCEQNGYPLAPNAVLAEEPAPWLYRILYRMYKQWKAN